MKTYEVKQSDDVIVPKKAANIGAQADSEADGTDSQTDRRDSAG